MKNGERTSWLDRPGSTDKVFRALWVLCALLFLADAVYAKHPILAVEGWFGFYAVFGFVFSIGLLLLAKGLRRTLKRKEDYYD
jgi:hypothetical protein